MIILFTMVLHFCVKPKYMYFIILVLTKKGLLPKHCSVIWSDFGKLVFCTLFVNIYVKDFSFTLFISQIFNTFLKNIVLILIKHYKLFIKCNMLLSTSNNLFTLSDRILIEIYFICFDSSHLCHM